MPKRFSAVLALLPLALAAGGCPKEDRNSTARPAATSSTAETLSHGTAAQPGGSAGMEPTPRQADPRPAAKDETVIHYRWSGGLSPYQYYALTIRGSGSSPAKVTFVVKPQRTDEKQIETTLDAAEFATVESLFEKVGFDSLGQKPRAVRILDLGQTVISRDGGGHPPRQVIENGRTAVDGDDAPLKVWLDAHVRLYLEQAGVGLKRPASAPSPSPTPT